MWQLSVLGFIHDCPVHVPQVDQYRQGGAAMERTKSTALKDTEERLAGAETQVSG
jgi:hypothetical protein